MNENSLKTAFFITLPREDAKKDRELSGMRAFTRDEMVTKVSALNGKGKNYKVVELDIPENGCKSVGKNCVMIPRTSKAIIKDCHEVEDFINQ
ncbi:MAG: hypothetical protein WAZ12_04730 [Candidatus Absconditicoccaceae bacterium]